VHGAPRSRFTNRPDRKFWNDEQETNPKKIKPTREFALKHIKRMPDLYHKSQPENLYGIMRWHGHLTWASTTGMGMGMGMVME